MSKLISASAEFESEKEWARAVIRDPHTQNIATLAIFAAGLESAVKMTRIYCEDNPWLGISVDTPEQENQIFDTITEPMPDLDKHYLNRTFPGTKRDLNDHGGYVVFESLQTLKQPFPDAHPLSGPLAPLD